MATRASPLGQVWTAVDSATRRVSISEMALGSFGRNPSVRELELGRQFLRANNPVLASYGVDASLAPKANGVELVFRTSHTIGAVPLLSPSTGRAELGLVIRPRFGWASIGALMGETGAEVIPELPRLPALPRSEHEVPRWVLGSIICARLEALLGTQQRKFLLYEEELDRPRGRVQWTQYIARQVAQNKPNRVPCEFTALQPDATLLAVVHAAVLSQIHALQRVKRDALVISRLIARFERLRLIVCTYPPSWIGLRRLSRQVQNATLSAAIEAMEWTHDERGLGGLAHFAGLPWRLSMEQVFEARVEALARLISLRTGGIVRTGRLRETQRSLRWDPPYTGSQRTLLPDVEIVRQADTVILDAKYKSHWEDLDARGWYESADSLREAHRNDLLQVLAYGAATEGARLICALVYPCKDSTWLSLLARKRLVHRASVPAGSRAITLVLMAIPFERPLDEIAGALQFALTPAA
jgi:hypothetical protein